MMRSMISDREIFDLSGPLHLTCVNCHSRELKCMFYPISSLRSSLGKSLKSCSNGVYILERDRQENRQGPQALASRWWEFFGFRLHTQLIDDADDSIFGAIYEFTVNGTPRYVIAFRGTITKGDAFLRDLQMDLQIIKNRLHQTSRFKIAMQSVRDTVTDFGNSDIWLTGHSLGAAIAMLAGKTMAEAGIFLEAFLFNPPVVSVPIGRIKNKNVQQVVRITRSFLAAGVTVARKACRSHHQQTDVEDPFVALSGWVPRLYVHRGDHICSEYVGYFEHRKTMEKIGAGRVERNNVDHQRSVAACFVRGVYFLERDRQENRRGPQALASSWWEFFGFRLHAPLIDDVDHSIFGAIYEFTSPSYDNHLTANGTPRYIIAFRGTLANGGSFLRDFQLNLHLIENELHRTSRFEIAMRYVWNTIDVSGSSDVWLTGHSQGAAMAMLAGKTMAKAGIFLEAFLFNPPFISAPIERIKDENVKHVLRVTKSFLAAGLSVAAQKTRRSHQQQTDVSEDPFVALSGWVPRLYVHLDDHICSEYLGYFEHRKTMEEIGAGCVERLATRNSVRGLLRSALGKESEEVPLHLMPSANLVVNLTPAQAFKAHGIHQWWRSDLQLQSKVYKYRSNVDHRRSVAACLVQGVYILERDRQENRQGPQALASRWWEFFAFRLHTQLIDDADHSIFGAIYELMPPSYSKHLTIKGTPRYIIAFRGTLTKGDAFLRDFQLDLHIIKNGLHQTSRFEIAMQSVRNAVAAFRNSNIWLTGHSMGAAMAMLAGKTMAKTGVFLEAFLFNPPFFSAPIERIKDKNVRHGIRIASSFLAAGLTVALKSRRGHQQQREDPFVALSEWVPRLYVHPGDHICSEYIGYFDHRKKMEDIGAGGIERLATQNSLGGLVMSAMGKESEEPLHLIPSAHLIVNLIRAEDFKQAHGIHQWWRPDLQLQSKVYNYR
ncbi:hypothetical protein RHGRI_019917 [Rhododendron griersonianum]|uniref:Fungal lipase-type domain-containing protein n=1 Tax=Rhododendron griersonianum TaxID=479676 RepID=A0AAV6JIQ8_9ERIC|nr:hypothetical protein RHGRI_019917 [Rhododendron griersonianum]